MIEYEERLPPDLRHGRVENVDTIRRDFTEPNAAFLATSGQDAIGCVAVKRLDASTALVVRLFVKLGYRGEGIARKLVAAALEFVGERRYQRVVLDTDKDRLHAAYKLYRSLGFTECEPYGPVDYESPTYMELHLNNSEQ